MNDAKGKLVTVDHDGPVCAAVRELCGKTARFQLESNHAQLLDKVRCGEVDAVFIQFERETPEPAETLRALRNADATVALFACADLSSSAEAVLAYELGADDYVTSDIERAVLEAKLWRGLRRRAQWRGQTQDREPVSDIRELRPEYEIDLIKMTRIEERLCRALNRAPGQTVSFDDLLESVWGKEAPPASLLYEHISSLRAKLFSQGFTVRNLRGKGYRLEPTGENAVRPRRRSG